MIFKQNITKSLLLSLSNPVKSDIPKKGWESLIDSVVSGLYLVNCKTWKSKKKRDFFFLFRATRQEYQLGESSPSELLILPCQSSNRSPSSSWPRMPRSASHQRKQKKARRKKTRESPHSCKWGPKLLWVRAKWSSTVMGHGLRCLVAPSQTWRQQSSRHPHIPGSLPPWVRHSIFPRWSACSPGRPLLCPARN